MNKVVRWALTPWLFPARLRSYQRRLEHNARQERKHQFLAAQVASVVAREHSNSGEAHPGEVVFDPFDDRSIESFIGQTMSKLRSPVLQAGEICNELTAARFCMSLLQSRADLRQRFPKSLQPGDDSGFSVWLKGPGRVELELDDARLLHVQSVLAGDFAGRARQVLLFSDEIRAALPHGLTPPGAGALFACFVSFVYPETELRLEEIWWLFAQAAQVPALELLRAYQVTPSWQTKFPAAMTVFGFDEFAEWFKRAFAAQGAWIDEALNQSDLSDMDQVRLAYRSNPEWRQSHPEAEGSAESARTFLVWLGSPDAPLSPRASAWCQSRVSRWEAAHFLSPGLNVIGHFSYPSGLRASVDAIVSGLAECNVQTSLRNIRTNVADEPVHMRFCGQEIHDPTLIHVQPTPFFREVYGRADLAPSRQRTYRIAYWYWEFDQVPTDWGELADEVDEIWTATEFVAKGLRERFDLPVRTLFPGVLLAPYERNTPSAFGLPEEAFTFLFVFHMMSVMERKNPLGLIRAFRQAFRPDESVQLVLKTSFGDRHPEQFRILEEAADQANITLINEVYPSSRVLSLMDACDAYVSLHRSEGLGLTMAEAMLMGKPVIATNYSGNIDFMDASNSLLVDYELVSVGKGIPPYSEDSQWAEPSIDHAAQLMRKVYTDQAWARALGAAAKQFSLNRLVPKVAGQHIVRRLAEIQVLRSTMPR